MVETLRPRKGTRFELRIDPQLKAAFTKAARAEHRPPAQLVESFMRVYVRRAERHAFGAEARRQSREAASLSRNPESDEFTVMAEIEDAMADVWGDP